MRLIKVENESALVRDSETNAILNVDSYNYDKYIKMREERISQKQKMQKIESDIDSLKSDISDIKKLIGFIAEQIKGQDNASR